MNNNKKMIDELKKLESTKEFILIGKDGREYRAYVSDIQIKNNKANIEFKTADDEDVVWELLQEAVEALIKGVDGVERNNGAPWYKRVLEWLTRRFK